ncbi:SpoIIE family protein phosphatase [Streptomyces sp. NPDC046866]|uniref:SpoIIE family protein phosphatase n=1 Tax=Streptomyces sp. NPDC046866 TaxID=3154921 RepID=UPI0034531D83
MHQAPGEPVRDPEPGTGTGTDTGSDTGGESDAGRLHRAVRALTGEIAALQAARADHRLRDLATGVLVAELGVSPAEAAEHLGRLAADTRVSVFDVAADIVNASAGAPADPAARPSPPSAAARRLRRTDTAVGAAEAVGQAAAALLEGGLAPLGVREVWLWRRTATDCLQLAAQTGGSAFQAVYWQWLPAHLPGALRTACEEGEPRWFPAGPPPGEPLPGPAPGAARAVLPLRRHGAVDGVLLAAWPGPVSLDPTVRRALESLADTAARVLDAAPDPAAADTAGASPPLAAVLDSLTAAALLLHRPGPGPDWHIAHANPVAQRLLAGVPEPVGRPLAEVLPEHCADLERLVARALADAAPRETDRIAGDGAGGGVGGLTDVRALPVGPGRSVLLWRTADDPDRLLRRVLDRLEQLALFEEDLVSGTVRWSERAYSVFGMPPDAPAVPLRELLTRVHPEDKEGLAELLDDLTIRQEGSHTLVRVIRGDGGTRYVRISAEPLVRAAATVAVTGVFHDVSARYLTELALGATYDQLTVVEAQAAARHEIVRTLQRAIVPEVPASVELPGLQAVARYRPAAHEYRVGGDWYEVLPLADGRVMVAVGDIAGHGVEAATAMVALRNTLRGLAFTGAGPGRLMGWLNEVSMAALRNPTATAACALYEPEQRLLRWSSAGHLPLILLRGGRASLLQTPGDILLGALPSATYAETVTELRPGDLLVLYTDGLVERRHSSLDDGMAQLMRSLEPLADAGLDAIADRLLAEARGNTDDDTSLVLVRVVE